MSLVFLENRASQDWTARECFPHRRGLTVRREGGGKRGFIQNMCLQVYFPEVSCFP